MAIFVKKPFSVAPFVYVLLQMVLLGTCVYNCDDLQNLKNPFTVLLWISVVLTFILYFFVHLRDPGFVPFDKIPISDCSQSNRNSTNVVNNILSMQSTRRNIDNNKIENSSPGNNEQEQNQKDSEGKDIQRKNKKKEKYFLNQLKLNVEKFKNKDKNNQQNYKQFTDENGNIEKNYEQQEQNINNVNNQQQKENEIEEENHEVQCENSIYETQEIETGAPQSSFKNNNNNILQALQEDVFENDSANKQDFQIKYSDYKDDANQSPFKEQSKPLSPKIKEFNIKQENQQNEQQQYYQDQQDSDQNENYSNQDEQKQKEYKYMYENSTNTINVTQNNLGSTSTSNTINAQMTTKQENKSPNVNITKNIQINNSLQNQKNTQNIEKNNEQNIHQKQYDYETEDSKMEDLGDEQQNTQKIDINNNQDVVINTEDIQPDMEEHVQQSVQIIRQNSQIQKPLTKSENDTIKSNNNSLQNIITIQNNISQFPLQSRKASSIITTQNSIKDIENQKQDQNHNNNNNEKQKQGFKKNLQIDIEQNDQYIEKRYCNKCNVEQPVRAKHCKDCRRCVATFDHHCPWLGTCIGERNRCTFYWYLIIQFIEIIIPFVMEIICLTNYEGNKFIFDNFLVLFVLVIIFLFGFMVGILIIYHTFLVFYNLTTWENVSWYKISYLKELEEEDGSPFSQGVWKNIKYYCTCKIRGYNLQNWVYINKRTH